MPRNSGNIMIGLIRWLSGKESTCQAGDVSLISGLRRFPGEGGGNPLQYSCLENPMNRRAWLQSMESQRVRHDLVTKPPPPILQLVTPAQEELLR